MFQYNELNYGNFFGKVVNYLCNGWCQQGCIQNQYIVVVKDYIGMQVFFGEKNYFFLFIFEVVEEGVDVCYNQFVIGCNENMFWEFYVILL